MPCSRSFAGSALAAPPPVTPASMSFVFEWAYSVRPFLSPPPFHKCLVLLLFSRLGFHQTTSPPEILTAKQLQHDMLSASSKTKVSLFFCFDSLLDDWRNKGLPFFSSVIG